MDKYPFFVYFNVPHLEEKDKLKIKAYFNIKRKSQGGECGGSGKSREEEVMGIEGKLTYPDNLSELKESLLKSEMQMNQAKMRVQVDYIQDAASRKVNVQIPEMVEYFYDLLHQLNLDSSQVDISTECLPYPAVHLAGPTRIVMELKTALKRALDTLTDKRRTPAAPAIDATVLWCSMHLEGGLTLMVRQGDITKEKVDAIVNAANENLDHIGGVAMVISQAGGPLLQSECREWVKRRGQVPAGKAVKTTAGFLPCKMVIHAVGPRWEGEQGVDKVRGLLECAVRESLEIAEQEGCQSLAIPCLSSGLYSVPVHISAQTIVETVRNFSRVPRTLQSVTLLDVRRDTVSAFQTACVSGLWKDDTTLRSQGNQDYMLSSRPHDTLAPDVCSRLEVVLGNLEDQQVDILVAHMINTELRSTKVGKSFVQKGGDQLKSRFAHTVQGKQILPGDVIEMNGVTGLACKQICFIQCIRWDGLHQGKAVEALRKGLKRVLEVCENQALNSISFPVMGPGIALGFPHDEAVRLLADEIAQFEQTWLTKHVSTIRIVIKPSEQESAEAIQDAQEGLFLDLANQSGPSSFFHSITSDLDEITVAVGRVRVQFVFGNILNETTDVIVNSTDFSTNHAGVCKDILSVAGVTVQREVESAQSKFQMKHAVQETAVPAYTENPTINLCGLLSATQRPSTTAVFEIIGQKGDNLRKAKERVQSLFDSQVDKQEFPKEDLSRLTEEDIQTIVQSASSLDVQLEQRSDGTVILKGLKPRVNYLLQLFQRTLHEGLLREMTVKEQNCMWSRVMWCLEKNGDWEHFPREANYLLETGGSSAVMDASGGKLCIDLQKMEATNERTAQAMRIKRLESQSDFTVPLYWDNMGNRETLKKVELQPSSSEYQRVKNGFLKTAGKTVIKIERVQNVRLRQSYEVQRKRFEDKNGVSAVFEKSLYHGTTQEACSSIEKDGFNRRFAGQNGTYYGLGVYFAVHASYSVHESYAKPDADGLQHMYVVRVLTGHYTKGEEGMKVPPPRTPADIDDRYDSLVDNLLKPNMFIVFHDSQAYPDYLITFK
ncbi:protein mono-ADP-ribosyltransferase PARP14 [Amia ocellicauda]|uniref:protein mono-ADP-ribosyltransferase PARP14 n=1 Tax=Amia ocellicauda TaxID=2972642 RepID=UPI003464A5BA